MIFNERSCTLATFLFALSHVHMRMPAAAADPSKPKASEKRSVRFFENPKPFNVARQTGQYPETTRGKIGEGDETEEMRRTRKLQAIQRVIEFSNEPGEILVGMIEEHATPVADRLAVSQGILALSQHYTDTYTKLINFLAEKCVERKLIDDLRLQDESPSSKYFALCKADFFAKPEFKILITEFLDKSRADFFEITNIITAPAASAPVVESSPAPAASFPAEAPHLGASPEKTPDPSQITVPPYQISLPAVPPKLKLDRMWEDEITSQLLSSLMQFIWE